ncbi:MAG: MBL fold metallo-hydrolase [Caldisericaceae bacterium]
MKIEIKDGQNNIGGNKIFILDKNGKAVILDFGKNFSLYGKYFEEFLTPRAGAGIYDFWKLNLVPHARSLYREDVLAYVEEINNLPSYDPVFLFISHAHVDHFGYVPFLREDIPIISTKITYDIIKSYQDTTQTGLFSEFYAGSKRSVKSGLKENKLHKGKDTETFKRSFITDFPNNSISEFEGFKYRVFEVDHSVPGASSIYLEVDGVKVAYTGDLRFHGKNAQKTKDFFYFLKEIGVNVLITEGTRIGNDFIGKQYTESDVKEACLNAIKENCGKLVIADFGARNIERLQIFVEVSKETNRKIAITTKDLYLLDLLKEDGINIIDNENLVVIESKREQERNWKKELLERYKNKVITIKEINDNQGDYIVCYSFWDMPNLLDMKIDSGAYIYSTSEAFNEEQILDIERLLNWLRYFNLKPYGITFVDGKMSFTREYHVSGHANSKDLMEYIELAKPDYLIPVHSEHTKTFKEFLGEKTKFVFESVFEL